MYEESYQRNQFEDVSHIPERWENMHRARLKKSLCRETLKKGRSTMLIPEIDTRQQLLGHCFHSKGQSWSSTYVLGCKYVRWLTWGIMQSHCHHGHKYIYIYICNSCPIRLLMLVKLFRQTHLLLSDNWAFDDWVKKAHLTPPFLSTNVACSLAEEGCGCGRGGINVLSLECIFLPVVM